MVRHSGCNCYYQLLMSDRSFQTELNCQYNEHCVFLTLGGYWGCWSPAQESGRSFLELNLAALYLSLSQTLSISLRIMTTWRTLKNCKFMDLQMVQVRIDRQKSAGMIFRIWQEKVFSVCSLKPHDRPSPTNSVVYLPTRYNSNYFISTNALLSRIGMWARTNPIGLSHWVPAVLTL